jgi:hypothetical protein
MTASPGDVCHGSVVGTWLEDDTVSLLVALASVMVTYLELSISEPSVFL